VAKMITISSEGTEAYAASLAPSLQAGDVVALFGDLGVGKTAFVRGLARGLGFQEQVNSPTYAFVHEYAGGHLPLAHFDMYRLQSECDLESVGYYDYLDGGWVLAIEWSEKIPSALPDNAIRITIEAGENPNERRITVIKEGGAELADIGH
jgi:tRNA threonylcarbamoyladenosine biosynthesis protein TsaE